MIAYIQINRIRSKNQEQFTSRCEIESYEDTVVTGKDFLLLNYTDKACSVHAYNDYYEPINNVPVVKAATEYTSSDGRNYILILNESLWIPNMKYSLLNPN